MNKLKSRTNNSGFTLIEIMIVVAIIGILSAFAIPNYINYVERTKVAGAASVIASWQTAVEQCILDSGTRTGCNDGVAMIPSKPTATTMPKFVSALTTTNGIVTATTTGKGSNGSYMGITYTPTTPNGYVEWALTGSGCKEANGSYPANPSRGIDCGN